MRQLWLISTNGFHVCLCLLVSLTCAVLAPAAAALGDAAAGKAIYNQACISCHGADGTGGSMAGMLPVTPRNLADRAYMQTRSADHLFHIIKHGGTAGGLSSAMPGFDNQFTDTQIRDTVAYIQSLSAAAPEAADATPAAWRIASMRLSIWPEYDDPRVLMIIRGEIEPPHALPATLNLPVPKGAELIGAGMISDQNALLNHPHQVIPGDAHDTLTITLPVPRFFAEWYYNPWTSREANRQFTYTFTPPYPIDQLEIDIQQPYEATDFRTTPEAMGHHVDGQGGKYALFSYRDLAAHAPLTFTVTYVKNTNRPSVTKEQSAFDGEIAATLLRQKTIVAFSLLAGFTGLYASCVVVWRNYRRHRTSPAAPATQLPPLTTSSSVALRPNFCSDCGRKLQPADVFCSGCGRSLHHV